MAFWLLGSILRFHNFYRIFFFWFSTFGSKVLYSIDKAEFTNAICGNFTDTWFFFIFFYHYFCYWDLSSLEEKDTFEKGCFWGLDEWFFVIDSALSGLVYVVKCWWLRLILTYEMVSSVCLMILLFFC